MSFAEFAYKSDRMGENILIKYDYETLISL